MMRHFLSFVLLGSALACAGESGGSVEARRDAWLESAPDAYVVRTCGIGFAPPYCELSAVEDGQVVAAESRFATDRPWAVLADPEEPIASMFASAEREERGCDRSVDFDATYAYPSRVYFDCGEEGSGVEVSCFVANSTDLEACR